MLEVLCSDACALHLIFSIYLGTSSIYLIWGHSTKERLIIPHGPTYCIQRYSTLLLWNTSRFSWKLWFMNSMNILLQSWRQERWRFAWLIWILGSSNLKAKEKRIRQQHIPDKSSWITLAWLQLMIWSFYKYTIIRSGNLTPISLSIQNVNKCIVSINVVCLPFLSLVELVQKLSFDVLGFEMHIWTQLVAVC